MTKLDFYPIFVAGILYVAMTALAYSYGVSVLRIGSYVPNFWLYLAFLLLFLIIRILRIVLVDRPDALTATIVESEFSRKRWVRYAYAMPLLVCLLIFLPAFSALKSSIPLINPHSWDGYFIALDEQIHGQAPWKLLQPILGYPIVTSILSGFYHLWILLIYAGAVFFAFYRNEDLRRRFFMTYFACWALIGAFMAIFFSSVGPCFVEYFTGRTDYVPLMNYLNEADQSYPVLVLEVQNHLLQWYERGEHGLGRGISAMPSMHVSIAFLFFLAMRHVSRLAGWLFGAFFVIIAVGSVHLAYHYAVDGYVSIIVTAILWKLAGYFSLSKSRSE